VYFGHGGFLLRNSTVRRCFLCHMLDAPLVLVTPSCWDGILPNAIATIRLAMETEAGFDSQAGLALFFSHTKYLRWDKGFPDKTRLRSPGSPA
jgi:hypothetical protein